MENCYNIQIKNKIEFIGRKKGGGKLEFLKSKLEKIMEILENRELVLSIILCIIAIIFVIQLFNIQLFEKVINILTKQLSQSNHK